MLGVGSSANSLKLGLPTSWKQVEKDAAMNKHSKGPYVEYPLRYVNALAGLNPEHLGELVEKVQAIERTAYYDCNGHLACSECNQGPSNHAADCETGGLLAALAKVKA
jgi:hypothetical protein